MPRPLLYNEGEIAEALEEVPLWNRDDKVIIRELTGQNFAVAVGIVNSIALIAESMDHHPDILIYGWNKVRIITGTHDRGGLTELDFRLAKKIDDLGF